MPWAESDEGDKFLRITNGTGPWQWPVTVASRNGGWWHYEGGAAQFPAGYCDGGLEPPGGFPRSAVRSPFCEQARPRARRRSARPGPDFPPSERSAHARCHSAGTFGGSQPVWAWWPWRQR